MIADTQQSKMRLSVTKIIKGVQFTELQLKDIRRENRMAYKQQDTTLILYSESQREQNANNLFNELFACR
ncbi:hypothetical protein F8M41_023381 [Gigaspora margarita]|uniref:Uncharacterized protein n=1 Tax=Gigaspora margarita TaxID=4874 RepID=A0A8H4ADJ0_GIGMA|nr:hypothetical protein F8M41_023381 [Gigaspora margarita]